MLTRICSAAAALTLVAIVVTVALSIWNQSLRQRVNERQQTINQGLAFSQVNTQLANSLVAVAARDNDEKIRKLLADNGITMKTEQAPPSAVRK